MELLQTVELALNRLRWVESGIIEFTSKNNYQSSGRFRECLSLLFQPMSYILKNHVRYAHEDFLYRGSESVQITL